MRSLPAALDRALFRLYRLCGYAAAALLLGLALLVAGSIATRLLGIYVGGLTAFSGYAMAGSSFLAFAYTFSEGGHIRVALLLTRLSGARRRALEFWCFGAASFFTAYLAWFFVKMTVVSWRLQERSEGSDAILLWIPQSLTAFGAVVLALCLLHHLILLLLGRPLPQAAQTSLGEA